MEHASAMRSIARLLLTVALLSASAASHAQSAASVQVVRFNIGAQAMKDALKTLANQSDIQIIFTPSSVKELTTEGVLGEMTTDEALDALLKGTGLEHVRAGDVIVVRDPKASSASAPIPPPIADTESQFPEVHMAQASGAGGWRGLPSDQTTSEQGYPRSTRDESADLGSVVVTGSIIRGVGSAGAPLIEINREDIDRAGFATTHELMKSLPQNFGGGASEDKNSRDPARGTNIGYGTGVNLRGLGNDSTLVLLNGRRVSPAGVTGSFVDVSLIPLTAVERIEVLTDGASALYGSDAVAGVVNFILRDDYHGAETRARFGSVAHSDSTERQFGQLLGTDWETASVLLAYEYHRRDSMAAAERDFASNSNLTPFGGTDFSSRASNPGNITIGAQNFAIPPGQDGTDLDASEFLPGVINLQNTREGVYLLGPQERHSAFLSSSWTPIDGAQLFADALYSQRKYEDRTTAPFRILSVPSTNPFYVHPTGGSGPVPVNYSFIDDLGPQISRGDVKSSGGSLGATVDIGKAWQMQTVASYSAEHTDLDIANVVNTPALSAALANPDPLVAFNPFGDGSNTNPATIESIRGFENQHVDPEVWMIHAKADGHLFSLPGGSAKLAVGSEYREESLEFLIQSFLSTTTPQITTSSKSGRDVLAGFAELHLPLVGKTNEKVAAERLEISIAGRIEEYSDFGSTSDPKIGVLWSPADWLELRGTAGTSFKAPLLSQLQSVKNIFLVTFPDPRSPTGVTRTLLILGTQDNLGPEEATTWTAGMRLQPSNLQSRVDISYFEIEIDDRVRLPASDPTAVLRNDSLYAPILTRNPSAAEVNALFSDPGFRQTPIPADQVGAIIDDRTSNIAKSRIRGADLIISQSFGGRLGTLDLQLNGSYLFDAQQAITATAPMIEQVSTILNPADFRIRFSASWAQGGLSTSAFVNYVDDYTDNLSFPAREIDSWTTVDVQVAYATRERFGDGLLEDVTLSLNIQNLLDEDPPFANGLGGVGYDGINASPLGRFASLQVAKEW